MTKNKKIEKIERYVRKNLNELNWIHTQEVRCIAQNLAKREGGNKQIIDIAILLHDIAKDKKPLLTHARYSATIARRYLKKLKFDGQIIKAVVHAIESHSSPWAQNGPMPATIEAQIVFDADMIQQLSLFGIVKHVLKHKDKKFGDLIAYASKDLFECHTTLMTKAGRIMAKQRIKYVKKVFQLNSKMSFDI